MTRRDGLIEQRGKSDEGQNEYVKKEPGVVIEHEEGNFFGQTGF